MATPVTSVQALFADLGPWEVCINSDRPEVLERLAEQFGYRARNSRWGTGQLLTCNLVSAPERIAAIRASTTFDGPRVKASEGVFITYALAGTRTLLDTAHTAVAELDDAHPDVATVYLDYGPMSLPKPGDGKVVRPEPESFLYPLLAEWLRTFGACLLHCGAVVLDGRAVVLSGPPGSGKSTHVLRLLNLGAQFIADDLAILHRVGGRLEMLPLREVANVNRSSLDRFPELASRLANSPLREDGKHCVDIPTCFGQRACRSALPGAVIRLHPDAEPWMQPCPAERRLDNVHAMAWFVSRSRQTAEHFWLIADWLAASQQWEVSRGFLSARPDEFLARVREGIAAL
jgi:hypothetical protein